MKEITMMNTLNMDQGGIAGGYLPRGIYPHIRDTKKGNTTDP